MSDIWKVGGSAGVAGYASLSDAGVFTLSDGTTTVTWTPGGAISLVNLTLTGNTALGNADTDTLSVTADLTTGLKWDAGTYTYLLDCSAMTTGQADIVIGDNLADALTIREAGNAYVTLVSTDSGEKIQALKAVEMASTLLVSSNLTCGSSALLGDASDDAHVLKGTTTFDCLPALGAHMTLQAFDSGLTSLDTGDASTVVTLSIPAGALVIGAALKVTTEITGANSTTGTLALTGGSSTTLLTISAFTANTLGKGAVAAPTSATTEASFVLSGGGDDIPTAGAIRVVVYAYVMNNLD